MRRAGLEVVGASLGLEGRPCEAKSKKRTGSLGGICVRMMSLGPIVRLSANWRSMPLFGISCILLPNKTPRCRRQLPHLLPHHPLPPSIRWTHFTENMLYPRFARYGLRPTLVLNKERLGSKKLAAARTARDWRALKQTSSLHSLSRACSRLVTSSRKNLITSSQRTLKNCAKNSMSTTCPLLLKSRSRKCRHLKLR